MIIDHHRSKLNTKANRTIDGALGHRAIVSAHLEDKGSSQADLAELTEGWWRPFFRGYCNAILKKFDHVTEDVKELLAYDLSSQERFYAAMTLAVAAKFAGEERTPLSTEFRRRALENLETCSWVGLPAALQVETLGKYLRELPGFDEFISKHGIDQDYCFIESYEPVVESECVLGSSPQDSIAQHATLSNDGFWPGSITCHIVGDRIVSSSVWHRELISQQQLEEWSQRQMRALVGLIRLGFTDDMLSHLEVDGDPRLRTRFVHECRAYGISSPEWVMPLLARKNLTPSQTIALIQYLGLYQPAEMAAPLFQQLTEQMNEFVKSPHPGIHGSATWLQRIWRIENATTPAHANFLASNDGPSWIQQPNFGEMIVLPPGVFVSGSIPVNDPDIATSQTDEKIQLISIPHRFALSTYPVTVTQYDRFLSELKGQPDAASIHLRRWLDEQDKRRRFTRAIVRTEDSPVTKVGIDAVYRYCNWLSKQAAIPEDQWCYKPKTFSEELAPIADLTLLSGFRLPTVHEWEYACRAGTTTRRYYGFSDEFLPDYAWFIDNSDDHVWPTGLKKPNDWGFFDMYGNIWQVCAGQLSRGGDYDGPSVWMRSSFSPTVANAVNHEGTGFRVARTLLPTEKKTR